MEATVSENVYSRVIFNINGQVIDEDTGIGIPDARIRIQHNINGVSFPVGETLTDSLGQFSMPYDGFPGGHFVIMTFDQPGYFSDSANPGPGGSILTPNIVTFPANVNGSLDTVTFLDTRRLTSRAFDRHYLVVYSAPATFSDIFPLVQMKRMQGYQVEAITTQVIETTMTGRDLAEKIRNW